MAEILHESSLRELGLPVRILHALQRHGCRTIGDLLELDFGTRVRGLGRSGLAEVARRLEEAGFTHPGEDMLSEIERIDQRLEKMEQQIASVARALGRDFEELRSSTRRGKLPGNRRRK